MTTHSPRVLSLALALALFVGRGAAADAPEKTAEGDLSQVGDVGPAPTSLEGLLELQLSDSEARRAFEQALELIGEEYAGWEITEGDLYLGAIAGMVQVLNTREQQGPASTAAPGPDLNALMTTEDSRYVNQMERGHKTGIGIEFQASTAEGLLYITRVYPGSPADRNGIRAGDRVAGIDGNALQQRDLQSILGFLRGAEGTPIGLTLLRGAAPAVRIDLMLTRAVYDLPSVETRLVSEQVGLMRISQFHGGTATEVRDGLADMEAVGITSLILDLRGNQGGLLSSIQEVASMLLGEEAVLARLLDARGRERDLVTGGTPDFEGPMVCLVNRWTGSGAEMLASAIQENGRARLVGENTAGKATTETLYRLAPGLHLRLTTTAMRSPLGDTWQGEGLTPDFVVRGGTVSMPFDEETSWPFLDVQLGFALDLLVSQSLAP